MLEPDPGEQLVQPPAAPPIVHHTDQLGMVLLDRPAQSQVEWLGRGLVHRAQFRLLTAATWPILAKYSPG